jgi:hypothetical protein
MGNYFCKLHLLVNFAEEVGKGFKVYESITFDQPPKWTCDNFIDYS